MSSEPSPLHGRLRLATQQTTYRRLGQLTGTHPETVRRYMSGQTPSVDFLAGLCGAFGLNPDWLLTGHGPMRRTEVRDEVLGNANATELLRAMSESVDSMIDRVGRLERNAESMVPDRQPDGTDAD